MNSRPVSSRILQRKTLHPFARLYRRGRPGFGALRTVTAAFAFTVFAETTVDVPLMRDAGHATQQGFVRITAAGSGPITIDAWNDSGVLESTTLSVVAGRTYHFNSDDLEMGGKGIPPPGIGSGFGDAYLQLKADFEFSATAYMRTTDGFLTSMGNTLVPVDGESFGTACVYEATIFNPASNTNQVSSLRIVERGAEEAAVSIYGIDDDGAVHGPVDLKVPANGARSVTSQQLEDGDPDLDGTLGDGTGKWRLAVATDGVIVVMNLLESPTNHLTNLGPVILPATSEANDLETPQGCDGAPPYRLIAQPPPPSGEVR